MIANVARDPAVGVGEAFGIDLGGAQKQRRVAGRRERAASALVAPMARKSRISAEHRRR